MKYLSTYRIFESRKENEDVVKDVLSKLPKDFYYRVKYGRGGGASDRNVASALGEHLNIDINIVKILNEEQAKIWSVDRREIKTKHFEYFSFSDVSKILNELFDRLSQYWVGDFSGHTGGLNYIGKESYLSGKEFIKLSFNMRNKSVPSFKVKRQVDNEISDIFSDVFDVWVPDVNIKESGDFYKISSIVSNMSPYQIPPMTEGIKNDFIDAITRFEIAMECSLISIDLKYRDYTKRTEYHSSDFIIGSKGFHSKDKNKELAIEFIKSNEIIEFTTIFKKRTNE
jgi:hypothetical protein